MTDHTPTPWAYRSSPHDDWGWIRGPKTDDGIAPLVAMARSGKWEQEGELDQHRINKTDPYGANAAFIVKAVNNHDALVKALTDLCDEVASEEQHGDGADDSGCQTCRAHKRARKLLRAVVGDAR